MIKADNENLIMQEACRICVDVGEYRMAFIVAAELNQQKTLKPLAHWGEAGTFFDNFQATWDDQSKQGNCPIGTSINTGKPIVFQNLLTNPRYTHCCNTAKKCGFKSCLSLPIKEKSRVNGALVIFHTKANAFDKKEIELLESLADNLSYGITNIRMQTNYKEGIKEHLMLADITDQTSDGVFTFAPNGIIQYVNQSFIKLCGVPFNEVMGVSIHEIECSKRNPEFYQAILGSIRTNSLRVGRFINKDRSGQEHDIDGRIAPIFDKLGKVVRYVVTVRDVSHEVRLQRDLRQAQKMEVITTVTEMVAVGLQKQLETILLHSTIRLEKSLIADPEQDDLLTIIGAAAKSKKMLDQLISISQPGNQPTIMVNFHDFVSQAITSLKAELPSTITIVKQLDPGAGVITASANPLCRAIKHLFDNAIEAMQGTGGILEVSLSVVDIQENNRFHYSGLNLGQHANLTITDTGHGIDRNDLEFIFDPFYSTKDREKKQGLGLPFVQRTIMNHGGYISANSIVGTGTSFTILLPLVNPIMCTQKNVPADQQTHDHN